MSPEFLDRLPIAVFYVVATVVLAALVLSRLAEASDDIAKLLGPVGRWLRRRAQQRTSIAQQVEYSSELKVMQRRISTLEDWVHKLETVEIANSRIRDMNSAYLQLDAEWHIEAAVVAAEKRLRLPQRLSYTEFCRKYRADEKRGDER